MGRQVLRTRLALASCALLLVALVAADLARPPRAQLASRVALSAIHWYQAHLSGRLGVRCRFVPTCSQYALIAIRRHGLVGGGWRAVKRLARCGPWTPAGTIDRPD